MPVQLHPFITLRKLRRDLELLNLVVVWLFGLSIDPIFRRAKVQQLKRKQAWQGGVDTCIMPFTCTVIYMCTSEEDYSLNKLESKTHQGASFVKLQTVLLVFVNEN